MTLRQYLVVMIAGTALAWAAVAAIIVAVNPAEASLVLLIFLYLSLFLAILGTLAVLGFLVRAVLFRQKMDLTRQVAVSFRQGVLLSALAVGALLFSSRGWLNWWTGIAMVVILTTVELIIISAKVRPRA